MPLTITKSYKDGRLVNIERLYSNYRKDYTPEEYIDFLEKQVWTLENEFEKNGRIVKIYH